MSATAVKPAAVRAPLTPQAWTARILGYGLVAAFAAWVVYEFVSGPTDFIEATLVGVNNGALYALIALGYTLVYGIIELINFSHGDLFMLSTVLAGTVIVSWFSRNSVNLALFGVMAIALLVVMAAAAAVNMTAERVAYRRLRRAPKLAPLITAVGLSFVYQWAGVKFNGSGQRSWPYFGSIGFTIGGVRVLWATVMVLGVTIPLLLLLLFIVQRTRAGRAMRATAQDQDAARLMGINVDRTIAFAFGLGGAMAGAAGVLYLEAIGTTRYDAGFRLGLIAFTAAVLGGIGRLDGAVLGGFTIGIIESLNSRFALGDAWSQTVIFGILIILMVFKPEGILGKPTTEKV